MMMRYFSLIFVLSTCILLLLPTSIHSLASSSSSSSSGKKKTSPRSSGGGGGGGFGTTTTTTTTTTTSSARGRGFTPDTSDATSRLLEFLKGQKAEISNVAIGRLTDNDGRCQRGLFATKNFEKKGGGQILCKIPSDCALALSDPAQKGQDTPTMAHGGANLWNMYLSPDAGEEKHQMFFGPYLDTLPKRNDMTTPTPDFLNADELQLLEFPRIIIKAQERLAQIQQVSQETGIAFDDLQYATWLVSSRALPIAVSADDETMAEFDNRGQVLSKVTKNHRQFIRVLVPLLDMVNHESQNPNAKWTMIDPQKDAAWFVLESTRPIASGQEITMAYGSGVDSSVELYQNYGIVLPPNQSRPHYIDTLMLKKGGNDCLNSINDWTTALQEDERMLEMISSPHNDDDDDDTATVNLKKILAFRIKLKQAYPDAKEAE
jgi:SET domain